MTVHDRTRHEARRAWVRRTARGLGAALVLAVVLQVAQSAVLRAEQGQVFRTPQGIVENLRFEQAAGGIINISYDLKSDDPDATFSIVLEVSQDGGASFTVKPTTISGDVGDGVRTGAGKKIVWLASRDVESLQIDQFKFNIRASAGAARPVPIGRLTVNSTPPGATVFVDGANRGVTPLTMTDVQVGSRVVRVVSDGFLENRRTVEVKADTPETLTVTLTAMPTTAATPPPASGAGQPPTSLPKTGGGVNKFVWIGAAAGGAAAAGLALGGGGGDSTPPPSISTAEICGNGIDDNGNGQVDEGCNTGGGGTGGGGGTNPAPTCTFAVSPSTVPQFAAAGGQQQVSVSATPSGCSPSTWTTSNGNATWVSISPESGSGSGSVTLTAQARTDQSSRSGTVTIAGQSANVSQSGAPVESCSFRAAFDGGSRTTSVAGNTTNQRRTINVEVLTGGSNCEWSVSGAPSWFGVVEGGGTRRGNGSVVMASLEVNSTGRQREARFSVAGEELTVIQCASICS